MFFTKALIINNMALIWDGRVLVVSVPLVIRLKLGFRRLAAAESLGVEI